MYHETMALAGGVAVLVVRIARCILRAGVYFEKYVKGKQGQTLWIRNLQLSIYGVPLSIIYTFLKDGR